MSDKGVVQPAAATGINVPIVGDPPTTRVPTLGEFNELVTRVTALEQGKPPGKTPSPDGTSVTTVGPAIIDAQLRSFTLTQTGLPAGMTAPGIAIDGAYSSGTQRVRQLYAKGGICHQQNLDGGWWNMPATAWLACADPTMSPPQPSTGAWTMRNGLLYRNGVLCVPYGPALLDGMMGQFSPAALRNLCNGPSVNFVNLACGADGNGYATAQSQDKIFAWVDAALALPLMVMLSDYVPGQPQVRSGNDLASCVNWIGALAKRYAGTDNVFWTMSNETNSGNGGLNDSWRRQHDAIRQNGSNTPIFWEARCGNPQDTGGFDAALFASDPMSGANIHIYPWEFNTGSSNQADYDATGRAYVAKWRQFSGRPDLCVLMGEGGNSTMGNGVKPDDPKVNGRYAVTQSILNITGKADGFCGAGMWLKCWYDQHGPAPDDADTWAFGSTLTPGYGVQCNGFVAPAQ